MLNFLKKPGERGVALITGASSGLGETYARKLGEQGFDLVLVARRKEKLLKIAEEIQSAFGVNVDILTADLTADDDIKKVADLINGTTNFLMLINNAGFGLKGLFHLSNFEKQKEMLKLHVEAPAILTRKALEKMIPQDRGAVINISSLGSFLPTKGSVMYVATKTFLRSLSESIAEELIASNVKIQALCPGFTRTEYHSSGGQEDFAEKNIPSFMWMESLDVVEISLRNLEKGNVVVIPGIVNKLSNSLLKIPGLNKMIISSVNKKNIDEF